MHISWCFPCTQNSEPWPLHLDCCHRCLPRSLGNELGSLKGARNTTTAQLTRDLLGSDTGRGSRRLVPHMCLLHPRLSRWLTQDPPAQEQTPHQYQVLLSPRVVLCTQWLVLATCHRILLLVLPRQQLFGEKSTKPQPVQLQDGPVTATRIHRASSSPRDNANLLFHFYPSP